MELPPTGCLIKYCDFTVVCAPCPLVRIYETLCSPSESEATSRSQWNTPSRMPLFTVLYSFPSIEKTHERAFSSDSKALRRKNASRMDVEAPFSETALSCSRWNPMGSSLTSICHRAVPCVACIFSCLNTFPSTAQMQVMASSSEGIVARRKNASRLVVDAPFSMMARTCSLWNPMGKAVTSSSHVATPFSADTRSCR